SAGNNSNYNTFVGYQAGYNVTTGSNDVFLGYQAGYSATSTVGSVFLGPQAGYWETESNRLYIDNRARANLSDARLKALIYGIFDSATSSQVLAINGKVGIFNISPSEALDVAGSIKQSGAANCSLSADANGKIICTVSSQKFKEDIKDLEFEKDKFLSLKTKSFKFKEGLPFKIEGRQVGFIAEEVAESFPDLVRYEGGKPMGVKYEALPVYLFDIVKKQEERINSLEAILSVVQSAGILSVNNNFGNLPFSLTADGGIETKSIKTEKLQVGTQEKPAGITLFDKKTKEAYCLFVEGGEIKKELGVCPEEAGGENNSQVVGNEGNSLNENNKGDNNKVSNENNKEGDKNVNNENSEGDKNDLVNENNEKGNSESNNELNEGGNNNENSPAN
ncbi:MAG: tail fiber domain-containing protein, partial [Minisyncoccales bacterium]